MGLSLNHFPVERNPGYRPIITDRIFSSKDIVLGNLLGLTAHEDFGREVIPYGTLI
jgi:uncharacterized cupin superfamily protein